MRHLRDNNILISESKKKRRLIYKYIYTLKYLRNALAHNYMIFDTSFRNINPNKSIKLYLQKKMELLYTNFKTISDYIILIDDFISSQKIT